MSFGRKEGSSRQPSPQISNNYGRSLSPSPGPSSSIQKQLSPNRYVTNNRLSPGPFGMLTTIPSVSYYASSLGGSTTARNYLAMPYYIPPSRSRSLVHRISNRLAHSEVLRSLPQYEIKTLGQKDREERERLKLEARRNSDIGPRVCLSDGEEEEEDWEDEEWEDEEEEDIEPENMIDDKEYSPELVNPKIPEAKVSLIVEKKIEDNPIVKSTTPARIQPPPRVFIDQPKPAQDCSLRVVNVTDSVKNLKPPTVVAKTVATREKTPASFVVTSTVVKPGTSTQTGKDKQISNPGEKKEKNFIVSNHKVTGTSKEKPRLDALKSNLKNNTQKVEATFSASVNEKQMASGKSSESQKKVSETGTKRSSVVNNDQKNIKQLTAVVNSQRNSTKSELEPSASSTVMNKTVADSSLSKKNSTSTYDSSSASSRRTSVSSVASSSQKSSGTNSIMTKTSSSETPKSSILEAPSEKPSSSLSIPKPCSSQSQTHLPNPSNSSNPPVKLPTVPQKSSLSLSKESNSVVEPEESEYEDEEWEDEEWEDEEDEFSDPEDARAFQIVHELIRIYQESQKNATSVIHGPVVANPPRVVSGGIATISSSTNGSVQNGSPDRYKQLYEKEREENEKLRKKLEQMNLKSGDVSNGTSRSNSATDDNDRRALERKIAQLEYELETAMKQASESARLKSENDALIRVLSKLSRQDRPAPRKQNNFNLITKG